MLQAKMLITEERRLKYLVCYKHLSLSVFASFLANNGFVKFLKNMRTLIKKRRTFKIKILLGSFNLDNGQPADGIILFSVYLK